MTESSTPKSFAFVHRGALVLLFLLMAQPTFDNVRALLSGTMVFGDTSIEVTFGNMVLHIVAMLMGWFGLWLFFQRQKRGAYLSIAAHLLGFLAALVQMPEVLFAMMPPAAIAVFFVILFAITLGPISAYKDEYT